MRRDRQERNGREHQHSKEAVLQLAAVPGQGHWSAAKRCSKDVCGTMKGGNRTRESPSSTKVEGGSWRKRRRSSKRSRAKERPSSLADY